jgi:spermidine synthase
MTRYKHTLFILITLLSGSAALVYETVWLRWFKILFGSTAYAASATLVAFFAGLTIGALLFGRLSEKVTRPLRIHAVVEFGVIITALAAPFALDLYDYLYPMLYESL